MIPNVITRVLEFVLYDKLVSASSEDVYQFGFNARLTCGKTSYVASVRCIHLCRLVLFSYRKVPQHNEDLIVFWYWPVCRYPETYCQLLY